MRASAAWTFERKGSGDLIRRLLGLGLLVFICIYDLKNPVPEDEAATALNEEIFGLGDWSFMVEVAGIQPSHVHFSAEP